VRFRFILVTVCLFLIGVAVAQAPSNNGFTPAQQKQIELIIHNYLIQNPQVLDEASKALQVKLLKQMTKDALKGARANTDSLLRSKSPIAGNPHGPITMVAFLDYQCPFCRAMTSMLEHLIKVNPELRIVCKEFPVHGKYSIMAAKVALAADLQGKYWEVHKALMNAQMFLTEQGIMGAAKSTGVDMKKLTADMQKTSIQDEINGVYQLAKSLKLTGDPSYFIMKTDMKDHSDAPIYFIPGYASEQEIQAMINKAG
jgi:protein-disulfide isomerase